MSRLPCALSSSRDRNCINEEDLRRIVSAAGYMPAQRGTLYRAYFLK